jgi:drug/metabolite transporter (DMT)-like permease/RimJ/RimL family protein N-acetyltransferase
MLNPATVRQHQRRDVRRVCLADGARVGLRPIRSEDADAFARAYTRLSELSRQRRFLSVAPALPPNDVRYLTSVDHHEHVALVAVGLDGEEILGSARYIRLPNRPGDAEMAIEVIDEWQHRGLGRALLQALGDHARARGVERFVALVASDNVPMQRILQRAGSSTRAADGELEYSVAVDALAPPHPASQQPEKAASSGLRDLRGAVLVLLSAAAFGSLAVLAQLAYGQRVSVLGLLVGRFSVAAVALWLVALTRRRPLPPRRDVMLGVALGAGYCFSALLFAASLRHIEAGLADLLLFAYPVMVSVGAVLIGRERWSARRAVALSVAGVGIAAALSGAGAGTIDIAGVSLALGAALVYAAYVLASSSLLRRIDPLTLAASVATGAAMVFCGYALARGKLTLNTSVEGFGLVIAVALTSSVIGTAAFMAGVRTLGASRASIISSAEPALTALFSWVTFGERFGAVQLLGAALLLASVPILELRGTRRAKRPGGESRRRPILRGALQPSRSPA